MLVTNNSDEVPSKQKATLLPFLIRIYSDKPVTCLLISKFYKMFISLIWFCILATQSTFEVTESGRISNLSRILPRWPLNWHDLSSLNFDSKCHMNGDTISCLSFLPHQSSVTLDPVTQSFSQKCASWTFHLWPEWRQACVCAFLSKDLWLFLSNCAERAQSLYDNHRTGTVLHFKATAQARLVRLIMDYWFHGFDLISQIKIQVNMTCA